MSQSIYLYTTLPVHQLEVIIESHKEDFDNMLNDTFSDEEMLHYEKIIDSIAAVYVQPILSELSFDDFYADSKVENEQRIFFGKCRSSISLENLPFLESNPVQITYLRKLLGLFEEVLIDKGGVHELRFKDDYLNEIQKFKSMDSLIKPVSTPIEIKTTKPVDPIDFLILDVYKEFERLKNHDFSIEDLSPKVQKIFHVMKSEKLDSTGLLRKIGLNPKDFDDGLERLKFWLRKF
jgi:hypothetical protein